MWILAAFLMVKAFSYTENFEDFPSIIVNDLQEATSVVYRSPLVQTSLPGNAKVTYRIDLTSVDWDGKIGGNDATLWLESDESPNFGYYQIYPIGINSTLNFSDEQWHLSWSEDHPYRTQEEFFICNTQKDTYWVQLSSEVSRETNVSFRVKVGERKDSHGSPCGSTLQNIAMAKVNNSNTDVIYESAKVHTRSIGGHDKVFYQVDLTAMDSALLTNNAQLRFSFLEVPSHGDWAVRINDNLDFSGKVMKRKTWSEVSQFSDDAFICSPRNQLYYFEIQSENTNMSTNGSFRVYVENHEPACGPESSDGDLLSEFFVAFCAIIFCIVAVLCFLCCMSCACIFLGVDAIAGLFGVCCRRKQCCYSTTLLSTYQIMEDEPDKRNAVPENQDARRISVKLGHNAQTDNSAVQLSVQPGLQE